MTLNTNVSTPGRRRCRRCGAGPRWWSPRLRLPPVWGSLGSEMIEVLRQSKIVTFVRVTENRLLYWQKDRKKVTWGTGWRLWNDGWGADRRGWGSDTAGASFPTNCRTSKQSDDSETKKQADAEWSDSSEGEDCVSDDSNLSHSQGQSGHPVTQEEGR